MPNSAPPKRSRMIVSTLLATGMVLTQIIGGLKNKEYIHLWPCSVLTAGLMLLTGCMNGDQARKSIMWWVAQLPRVVWTAVVCIKCSGHVGA